MQLQLISSDAKELPMQACSKYEKCSAPICPLDKGWRLRKHLSDPSCHFLKLVVKDAATDDERLLPAYQAAVGLWEHRDELPGALVRSLQNAALTKRKAGRFQKAA